jgi:hypothetical protein
VADVLLDRVEGDHQLGGNGRGLQVGVAQIRSQIRQLADMVVEAVGRFACVDSTIRLCRRWCVIREVRR